jgi:hypothetical protein
MMPRKSNKPSAEQAVRDIRRATRRRYSAEEKIRIVLEGLRDEDSIAQLCRREGINTNVYYQWSKPLKNAWPVIPYHESLDNLTPADVYFGRGQSILDLRDKIKVNTLAVRQRMHYDNHAKN